VNPVRTALCAALIALAGLPAWAAIGRDEAALVAQRGSGGGRVLSVERVDMRGQVFWRVKILTARGDVRVVLVDAETGQAQ
jgi:uncharacterized membrane protein YkoI